MLGYCVSPLSNNCMRFGSLHVILTDWKICSHVYCIFCIMFLPLVLQPGYGLYHPSDAPPYICQDALLFHPLTCMPVTSFSVSSSSLKVGHPTLLVLYGLMKVSFLQDHLHPFCNMLQPSALYCFSFLNSVKSH